ncbi:bifunctional diguanylate cyclase/phosphohydrolase [Faecalimicrobium sp. JNUCC 81]
MSNFDKKRNDKVCEIIILLKVIYIILSMVAISSGASKAPTEAKDVIFTPIIFTLILISILGYLSWMATHTKDRIDKKPRLTDLIETIFTLFIFTIVVCSTGIESSGYKLISVFVVLIGAIQFGKNYSIWVATFSSILIFIIDFLISVKNRPIIIGYFLASDEGKQTLSVYFESDLIIISALFVTAFILGMYVDIEREHSKELKNIANRDELTGLYNHRYFQEYLGKAMDNADKNNNEVSLLFMDIDYFKNYNDVNGHQAGDVLLKEIGKILKICVREDDVVARYGGEEFAAILPNTNENDAIKVGEKIRQSIQNTNFRGQENQPDKNITISIGVSSYPTRATSKHQFINTADDALYRAKSFNKNRVESYHSVLDDLCRQIGINEDRIKSLKSLISMINIKDRYTYGHTERVVIYTKWFAQSLNLSEEDQVKIQIASYLHDIGKLEIPEEVLNKKEKLTDEEFQMFRDHPQAGVDLIQNIKPFEAFISLIKHHHERYDGFGYPDRLKGEEIPYLARMLTIADSFDAMTSNRPYNVRKSHEEGILELRANAGTQFDPQLVEEFIKMLEKYKDNF